MSGLFSLEGRTALVTGGTRGIGAGIAAEFARAGATVITCARHADDGAIQADLSTLDGVQALAAAVAERTDRLHILVNNAGATWGAPVDDYPESGWDKVMDLNVKAMHYLTAACLPLLRAAATEDDPARVINIGSIDGIETPLTENYAYSASKAAVHQLTRHLARRLAPENILVNAIAPGLFDSKMSAFITRDEAVRDAATATIPLKRIGRPEEIGGSAVYLASRAGGYTTGEVLVVDGGRSGAGRAD